MYLFVRFTVVSLLDSDPNGENERGGKQICLVPVILELRRIREERFKDSIKPGKKLLLGFVTVSGERRSETLVSSNTHEDCPSNRLR